MPTVTRWHVKAGLIYFVCALLMGLAFRLQPFVQIPDFVHTLRPTYYHVLMVGWITQIIIGVSFWMFPRESRQQPRGDERLAWATFYLLNIGLLMRMFSEPFIGPGNSGWVNTVLFLSGLLQWLAALSYTLNIWNRIKLK